MASTYGIRVLEQSRVSPPPDSVPNSSLPLTFFDALWLHADPVQRLFFFSFPHPVEHFVDSFLPALKSSLSLALWHFYPLAGKIAPAPGSDGRFEIRYVDGDSVPFTLAVCDGDFAALSGSGVHYASESRPLLPRHDVSGDGPLLAVKVSVFPNSGVCVATSILHVACDGSSSMQFMRSWASWARSVAPEPVYDRTLMAGLEELYSFVYEDVGGVKEFAEQVAYSGPHKTLRATLSLTRAAIEKLKQWVQARVGNPNRPPLRLSTFVVACAYAWVCLLRSRSDSDDEVAQFSFAVDCRARLQPPVPASYFGNCLAFCVAEAKVAEIAGEDGVAAAAKAIGEALQRFLEEKVWVTRLSECPPRRRTVTVAGSPKFGVYETDFGWGRPFKVEMASIDNGAMSLAESRDEPGGVEIGVAIPDNEMDEFRSHFARAIENLVI